MRSFTETSFTTLSFGELTGVIRRQEPTGPIEGGGEFAHRGTARRPLGYDLERITFILMPHKGEKVDIKPSNTSHFMSR